jgi:DNA-binding NarL/FixJ family response regulator
MSLQIRVTLLNRGASEHPHLGGWRLEPVDIYTVAGYTCKPVNQRMPTSIALVDDDAETRRQLELLIDKTADFQCVGSFGNGEAALKRLPEVKPEVVLMDIQMPGISGIECAARLKAELPSVHILMLTVYEDTEKIFDALKAGAIGYLTKRTPPEDLIAAIQDVQRGCSPMSGHIARKVVQFFHRPPAVSPERSLTPREQQILDLLAKSYFYKEIADQLSIGTETVRTHIRSIYEKLQVRTRTEAVVKYLQKRDA